MQAPPWPSPSSDSPLGCPPAPLHDDCSNRGCGNHGGHRDRCYHGGGGDARMSKLTISILY